MSLLDAAERLASLGRSQVTLDANRCLHALDKFSACTLCFNICPENAIYTGYPPVLAAETCKSCLAGLPYRRFELL